MTHAGISFEAAMTLGPVPRGTELMRKIGVEPEVRTFDVLELG